MKKATITENYRNEWKYLCSAPDWGAIEDKLKHLLLLDRNSSESGDYQVHSLYFDDIEDSCMADNGAGNSFRLKFRIRYYGNAPETLHLECKKKRNGRCIKLVTNLTKEQYDMLTSGYADELLLQTDDALLKRFCLYFSQKLLTPKIIIDYDRTAYIEDISNIRITYDQNISASIETDRFLTGGYLGCPVSSCDAVLEVKFDNILPGYLARLINEKHLEVSSYSKYYLGRLKCSEYYRS